MVIFLLKGKLAKNFLNMISYGDYCYDNQLLSNNRVYCAIAFTLYDIVEYCLLLVTAGWRFSNSSKDPIYE